MMTVLAFGGLVFFFPWQWWVASSCRLIYWVNTAHSANC